MGTEEKIILPEKYYLDNFKYVLDFVRQKYEALLREPEFNFIDDFHSLSEDAQCLYVRLSNRKGRFFRMVKLQYAEIPDIHRAHEELLSTGFCEQIPKLEIEEEYALVNIYNKPEIVKKTKAHKETLDHKLPKSELVLQIVENIPSPEIRVQFYEEETILTQAKEEELAMIKLFFFGHNHGDMSDFVIRDIGHAKFIEIDESKLGQSFDTREEAEAVMTLSNHARDFAVLEESGSPELILRWFDALEINYFLQMDRAKPRADKLIHRVGYHLEKQKHFEEALRIYQHTEASPMRERQIRIYNKQKDFESAMALAERILEAPNDNKEYYIAQDVINRNNEKLKSTTRRQKQGMEIEVSQDYQYRVEQGALAYFEELGYQGVHSENSIWRSIFGLIFWEEIFDPEYNQIYQPLQRDPKDAFSKDFYLNRKEAIHQRLEGLRTKKQIIDRMQRYYEANQGVASMFVNWERMNLEAAIKLVEFLSPKQVKQTLLTIALDPRTRSSGFPDLFVWNEKEYHFYEVKSPTDHLAEKQLFWLEHFDQHKINAEVVLVKWS
ncbi:VRR-NUC domain-containing protein [Reichenbachiella ulvae]|uniref:phosphodiesterase I n=1 Tax=Reichenbachiella ulvae TaxID=2980104 RepID=A0ABT3D0A0_9BACT|nr:VRR-NUC domain-containing protein [Reichenbachiella ulvae]MCV9388888.1 VRR-NUC domain-containing protein [Reichenbachiella ulvae]